MRTIPYDGNSNTWGCSPEHRELFPEDMRWPGVLKQEIGEEYRIIEEKLNGLTAVWDAPIEGSHKEGSTRLVPCLESDKPWVW